LCITKPTHQFSEIENITKEEKKNKKITHLHDTYGDNLYKNSIRRAKFLNPKLQKYKHS